MSRRSFTIALEKFSCFGSHKQIDFLRYSRQRTADNGKYGRDFGYSVAGGVPGDIRKPAEFSGHQEPPARPFAAKGRHGTIGAAESDHK